MANYKTGAQRYNDRMDKIFARSNELGHTSLHGSKDAKNKAIEKKGVEHKPEYSGHIARMKKMFPNKSHEQIIKEAKKYKPDINY